MMTMIVDDGDVDDYDCWWQWLMMTMIVDDIDC